MPRPPDAGNRPASPIEDRSLRPLLLLHVCCGPCATHAIDRLQIEYHLIAFFFNPNVYPQEEYERRLRAAATVCRACGVPMWLPEYAPAAWERAVRGHEDEPEGGKRCLACFSLRLRCTAAAGQRAGIPGLATTLTVSPHKDSGAIHRIGQEKAATHGLFFVSEDFKKNHGFQKSVQRSRELGLYRQRNCGCRFSQRAATVSRS